MPKPGSGSTVILASSRTQTAKGDTVARRARKNRAASKAPRAKPWKPELKMLRNAQGVERQQTEEAAWAEARQLVRHYVLMGYGRDIICDLMVPPISIHQLEKLFAYDLKNGHYVTMARIGAAAVNMAASGNDGGMTRFMLRSKGGWKDFEAPGGSAAIRVQMIDGDDTI